MIGTCAVVCCRRIMRQTSSPSMPGRLRSSSTRSTPFRDRLEPLLAGARDAHVRVPPSPAGSRSPRRCRRRPRSAARAGACRRRRRRAARARRAPAARPPPSPSGCFHGLPAVSSAWWRTSLASTMKITSSAMLVAWSAMRSRLRLIRISASARSIVPGSAIM